MTAPRKIIDMDVVGSESSSTTGPLNANFEVTTQRKSRQLLIHIESLYRVVLKLEDFENPTAIAAMLVIKVNNVKYNLSDTLYNINALNNVVVIVVVAGYSIFYFGFWLDSIPCREGCGVVGTVK